MVNWQKGARPQVILVLPAYNEADAIGRLLDDASRCLKRLQGYEARIIVVDDGSTDGTTDVVALYDGDLSITLAPHRVNRGLGQAILTGLRTALQRATGPEDVIVTMDADDTHPPETIPWMLESINAGADLVIASRYRRGARQVGVPLKRRLLSLGARYVFQAFLRLEGVRDYTCGFRAFRADLIQRGFQHYGDRLITRQGFACTDELLVNLVRLDPAPKVDEVPFVLRYDRKKGDSKLELWKTVRETFRMLLHGRH